MAKGWKSVGNNAITIEKVSRKDRINKDKKFSNLIRNTKSLRSFDLKKEGEDLYERRILEEDKLLDAFENKLVKSKNAIKQAIRIKKERADAKEQKVAEKIEEEPVTEA